MAKTSYQTSPGAIRSPSFKANPLSPLTVVSQGKVSKPVPVPIGKYGPKAVPGTVKAPGASGTI
jgi:hypothetical protein